MSSLCLRSCSRARHARRRDMKILENQKCARSLHLATHTVDAAWERPLRTPVPGDVKLTIRIHCNEVKQAAHAISYIRQGRGHGIRRIQAAYTHLVRAGHKCEHAEECRTTMHAPCFSSFECPSRQNKILHQPPPHLTVRGRRVAIAASGCEWLRYRNASIPRKLRPRRPRRSTWTRIISQTAGPGPSGTQAPLLGRLTGPSVVCGHQAGLRGSMC